MGGRLIFPFEVEIAHLDTAATVYDDDLREPALRRQSPDDRTGIRDRRERTICALAQIGDKSFEAINSMISGNSPDSDAVLVFHFDDLHDRGLVGPGGDPAININDRLLRIREIDSGCVVLEIPYPPGMWATESRPSGFGIGRQRNLLKVKFMDRKQSTAR